MSTSLYNADGTLKTALQLAAEQDRARALYLGRDAYQRALRQHMPYRKPWVCEGTGLDTLLDATGLAALNLRRNGLRYAWILDLSRGGDSRPGVWCWSVRGLEWCGEI